MCVWRQRQSDTTWGKFSQRRGDTRLIRWAFRWVPSSTAGQMENDPIHNHASSLPVMRHEEIRSRRNALSLCHHWFGGIDEAAQCWTVALTQASAPLAAPNQQMKRLWVHSLWPHLKLMRLLSRICRDFPSQKIFKLSSRCEAAPFVTGIQSHL